MQKTLEQLKKLDDEKLQAYFEKHARYNPSSPVESQYFIRPGISGPALFSDDTHTLRDKFFKTIRGVCKNVESAS